MNYELDDNVKKNGKFGSLLIKNLFTNLLKNTQ